MLRSIIRVACVLSVAARAGATIFVVTSAADTDDGVCNTSNCTLREAINAANSTANSGGPDTINFSIAGSGVHTINLASPLPVITDPVQIFGITQAGYNNSPLIALNGTNAGSGADGLSISAGNCIVVGLAISSFSGDGIQISFKGTNTISDNHITGNAGYGVHINAASNNTIVGGFFGGTAIQEISANAAGGVRIEHVLSKFVVGEAGTGNVLSRNYIGLTATGSQALGNGGDGVLIYTANNTVGSTAAAGRNVISSNSASGVALSGAAASGNIVEGNYIGLTASGSVGIGNTGNAGVFINGAPNNTVGGATADARNVISGSPLFGVQIQSASGNTVQGNYIGLDATGTNAVPNLYGVDLLQTTTTIVIGNVISGNTQSGVYLQGDATGDQIVGNFIGTDKSGGSAVANDSGVTANSASFTIGGTAGTTPGGPCTGACNVISGNTSFGLFLSNNSSGSAQVQGNFIGTNVAGNAPLPNGDSGVYIASYNGATIGGTTSAARNVISANTKHGVKMTGNGVFGTSNIVTGNFIGTNANGTQALGNGSAGVSLEAAVDQNVIGGSTSGSGNLISGNLVGISLDGTGSMNGQPGANAIQGNLIGTDASGLAAVPNTGAGVYATHIASGNTIGGTTAEERNVISGNGGVGVTIVGPAESMAIEGNFIGTNIDGTAALGNGLDGVLVQDSSNQAIGVAVDPNTGAVTGAGNLISANGQNGVDLQAQTVATTNNSVRGNLIGTDVTGSKALPNSLNGVLMLAMFNACSNNIVGGNQTALRNVISGNAGSGVNIIGDPDSSSAQANVVSGNYLGLDASGQSAVGNGGRGVELSGAAGTIVGGTTAASRNVISANGQQGVNLHNKAHANSIEGNYIGTDAAGAADRGNKFEGIFIENAFGNVIGGTAAGAGNVISSNKLFGVHLLDVDAHDNTIQGNVIGADVNGSKDLGNASDGIQIKNAAKNAIGGTAGGAGNLIAFNKGNGVAIFESMADSANGDSVLGNSVFSNAQLGIDLGNDGVTPNDSDDSDPGANLLQNFPVITSAAFADTKINVSGSLTSAANTKYRVEFFGNSVADPSGFGEGEGYLGSVDLTTDGSGSAAFSTTLDAKVGLLTLTATATDPAGNTSEFSAASAISGTPPSPTPTPTPTPSAGTTPTPGQLLNISTRLQVLTGDNVLIGGFIITGTDPKKVLVRGLGPSLPVDGALPDPRLELHDASITLVTNDNWKTDDKTQLSQEQTIRDTTIPPNNDLESALVQVLPANNAGYTAILAGKEGASGNGLVEVYDLNSSANSRLANISTRGFVDIGDNVMIGGFIVGGANSKVLLRALGPSLPVNGALQDPLLELHNADGTTAAINDNWKTDQEQEIRATTIPPSDDRESALVKTLPPGNYTAVVRGTNNTTGVGLVEVYNLQ